MILSCHGLFCENVIFAKDDRYTLVNVLHPYQHYEIHAGGTFQWISAVWGEILFDSPGLKTFEILVEGVDGSVVQSTSMSVAVSAPGCCCQFSMRAVVPLTASGTVTVRVREQGKPLHDVVSIALAYSVVEQPAAQEAFRLN